MKRKFSFNRLDGEAPSVDAAIRSAMIWNFVGVAFTQIGLAAVFILLASRLDPATFGVFALASVLTDVFYTLGVSSAVDAIVQRQDFSRRTLSSVTWAAAAICSAIALAIFGVAATYGSALGSSQVVTILEVLSLTTLMLPFAIGPTAEMRRRLDLKGLALINMTALLTGALAALATSYTPAIEWSLVVQRVVTTATFIVVATLRTGAIPIPVFDTTAVKAWLSGVSRIFAGQGFSAATPRIVDLLMGSFFGPVMVGYFRVATRLSDTVMGLLINPLAQLWVTLLSRTDTGAETRRDVYLQLTNLMAMVALPGFVGLALTADEVVGLLLPADYAPVAGLLAVLCVLGVFTPLTNPRNSLFTTLRRFNYLVWFSVVDLIATGIAMLVTARFGPTVMLASGGLTSLIMIAFAVPIILRDLKIAPGELMTKLTPPYVAVTVMTAGVLAIEPFAHNLPLALGLLTKAGVGATIYIAVLFAFFRQSVTDALRVVAAR